MAQSGIFRTGMRGFNKKEVLQYIEDLNARTTAEYQAATEEVAQKQQENTALRDELQECRERLSAAEQNAEELQKLVDQYRKTVQQMNDAAAQVETLNRERVALSARSVRAEQLVAERDNTISRLEESEAAHKAAKDELTAQLEAEKRENEALRARLRGAELTTEKRRYYEQLDDNYRRTTEENRRYRALIGHVGTFVADVRQMNRSMLEGTCRQGSDALERADSELSTAIAQLSASRSTLAELRAALSDRFAAGDERLSELCERLAQDMPAQEDGAAE